MTFKQAIESTPDISNGYKTGLTAFGGYSNKVKVPDTTKLQGSVDIDACTTKKYPQSNRWDYAFAYKSEVFFVEIHTANTSEVQVVIKKLQWLKDWLNQNAPEINKLKAKQCFFWVQSKNFQIPKNSPQFLACIQAGIKPIPQLILD